MQRKRVLTLKNKWFKGVTLNIQVFTTKCGRDVDTRPPRTGPNNIKKDFGSCVQIPRGKAARLKPSNSFKTLFVRSVVLVGLMLTHYFIDNVPGITVNGI
jgi:hypothetical protein